MGEVAPPPLIGGGIGVSMKFVDVFGGCVAVVDDDDYDRVSRYKWYQQKTKSGIYARKKDGHYRYQMMHRFILCYDGPLNVDHANNDPLDNRKSNLRLATTSQNMANQFPSKKPNMTSSFKGVRLVGNKTNPWRADIRVNGKKIFLGNFSNETDAALAYDAAAVSEFGEFAYTNFKQTSQPHSPMAVNRRVSRSKARITMEVT